MTAPTFRPTPYPRPTRPLTATHSPAAAPRHEARPTGHRLREARTPLRLAGLVAVCVFGVVTLLLGVVGWVALVVAVLG